MEHQNVCNNINNFETILCSALFVAYLPRASIQILQRPHPQPQLSFHLHLSHCHFVIYRETDILLKHVIFLRSTFVKN